MSWRGNQLFCFKYGLISIVLIIFFGCHANPSDQDEISEDLSYKTYQLDEQGNLIHSQMNAGDFQLPEDCAECHPDHYQEWSNSRHGKSFTNPLFQELKAKTINHFGGEGERFCLQCHDPVSIIANPNNINTAINFSHGVSCDVCHSMTNLSPGVNTHPSSFVTAEYFLNPGEGIKYGPIENPEPNTYHTSVYSPLFRRSEICLPCHNLKINDVEAEITFNEWNRIPEFAMSGAFPCQECHMPVKEDGRHDHGFAGVDVDLTQPADMDPQFEKVSAMIASAAELTFEDENGIILDSIQMSNQTHFPIKVTSLTGHSLPSGTSFNREVWLELLMFDAENSEDTLFQSGLIQSNQQPLNYSDSDLVWFTTFLLDENGDTTSEVLSAHSILDFSLPGLATRQVKQDFPLTLENYNQIWIRARLLFRPVKPQLLQDRPDLLANIPVYVIDELDKKVTILP